MSKLSRIVIAVVGLVVVLVAVYFGAIRQNDGSRVTLSLREEWIPQMTFTGEIVAREKGFFGSKFDLKVEPGGFETDPIKLVAAGANTFGVAGAERVLQAVERGADLVVIGVVNQISPTVFIVLADSAIKSPKDFEGHKVGVLSGSNTEIIYRALLAKEAVNKDKITEVEISYDLLGFIERKFDVLPGFAYDEPLTLQGEKVAIRVINPSDFGIKAIGNVYFTKRSTLEQHRDQVEAFVRAMIRGWQWAFENPDEAIGMLRKVDPKLDAEKEKASLLEAEKFFAPQGYRLMEIKKSDWEKEVELLRSIGYLDKAPDLATVLAPQVVDAAYAGGL